MRRRLVFGIILLFACRDRAAERAWLVADSIAQAPLLAKHHRDSLVIDSVARTIPTDSIRVLARVARSANPVIPALYAVDCEQERIEWLYGFAPGKIAADRARDEEWSDADWTSIENRMPVRGFYEPNCPRRAFARHEVGNTDLDQFPWWDTTRPSRQRNR